MKKIKYLIFSFTLFILMNGCVGYKPIFSSSDLKFKINYHSINGNKIIGNQIYSKFNNLSKSFKKDKNFKNIDLLINAKKDKKGTTKNIAGKILEYKITLKIEIQINDSANQRSILNQTFVSSLNYSVQDKHSDTVKLEKKSINELIDKTYQEILIKLTQNI